MTGTIAVAVVLAAWSWLGIWMGVLDITSGAHVAALVLGNVVAGVVMHDTFFNDRE